jgi:hypothetical protein
MIHNHTITGRVYAGLRQLEAGRHLLSEHVAEKFPWGLWASELRSAHKFVFRVRPDHMELSDFGAGLVGHGLFRLPFKSCSYEWRDPVQPEGTNVVIMHVEERSADEYLIFWLGMCEAADVVAPQDTGMLVVRDHGREFSYKELCESKTIEIGTVFRDGAEEIMEMTREQFLFQQGTDAGVSIMYLLGFTTGLMSNGVTRRTVEVPERVTERRIRDGKAPLWTHSVVDLRESVSVAARDGHSGDRAGPRAHWRRGHFRRLAEGKVVPVAPCLVAGSEFGAEVRTYVDRRGAA